MPTRIIAAAALGLLLGTASANAALVTGSYTATVTSGTELTDVFDLGTNFDLTGQAITGVFTYDTGLLTQVIAGDTNTATGTGLGALTITLTINGITHTFIDPTSSSVALDSTPGANNLALGNSNGAGTANESFGLGILGLTDFLTGTDITQATTVADANIVTLAGNFNIQDSGPTVTAGATFDVNSLTINPQVVPTPEPASMTLLAFGLAGIATARARRRARG